MMRCLDCGNFHEEVSKRQPHCPTCLGLEDYRDSEIELDDPFLDNDFDSPESLIGLDEEDFEE